MITPLPQRVVACFTEQFGVTPAHLVRAPGRVNLIGEHTDYNGGFVLPLALDRAIWIALRPRFDDHVKLYSLDFKETSEFALSSLSHGGPQWGEYPKAVAWALHEARFKLRGWEGVVSGDVPVAAGLSSSAAFELASARAFAAVSGLKWDAQAMAMLGQQAENHWVGVQCGIMDQMISAVGKEGYAVLIDCRDLALQHVPLPKGTVVVILDTSTRRGLVDSAYNERRAQCEAAARFFGVPLLRDVSVEGFEAKANQLDPLTRRRARHVVTENERALQAAEAMRSGDAKQLGKLMDASHVSLRDDFEVSNGQLNHIVTIAREQPGCFGARMTGAGFGGCAIALVAEETATSFMKTVSSRYEKATGLTPMIYACQPANGAELVQSYEKDRV